MLVYALCIADPRSPPERRDIERLGFHLTKHCPQSLDRLKFPDSGDVSPVEVADPRDEDWKCKTVRLNRGISGETSADDPAVQPIDTDVPSAGCANGKVVAHRVDETGSDEALRHESGEATVGVVPALPAVLQPLELVCHVAGVHEHDPIAGPLPHRVPPRLVAQRPLVPLPAPTVFQRRPYRRPPSANPVFDRPFRSLLLLQ